ncbi:MAG: sulfurtransferase TusA family protein [Symbiobacteriia bacterium]
MAVENEVRVDRLVDARGSFCPGPLMELIRAFKAAQVGEVIGVLSTESGSARDVPAWAQKAGQELVGVFERDGYSEIVVRKKK